FYGTGIVLTLLYMHHVIEQLGAYLLKHSSLLIGLSIFLLAIILGWKTVKLIIKKILSYFPESWQLRLSRFNAGLRHYFSDIGQTYLDVVKTGKWRLAVSIIILFYQWFTKFTILAIILISLDIPFTWFDMYIKQWIIWMGMLIIPTPGASGGAEAAFLVLFKGSLSGDLPNLIVSTWRFFTYYFILILSVILFNMLKGQLMKKGQ
nr:flippase-like domain-containing protein [Saprospiraceae bacterium]